MPYLLLLLRLKLCTDWYASPTVFASDNMGEELGYSPPYANILLSGQEQECRFSVGRRRYSQNEPTCFRMISLHSLICSFYCCRLASSSIANAAHFCFTVPSLFLPLVHISMSKIPTWRKSLVQLCLSVAVQLHTTPPPTPPSKTHHIPPVQPTRGHLPHLVPSASSTENHLPFPAPSTASTEDRHLPRVPPAAGQSSPQPLLLPSTASTEEQQCHLAPTGTPAWQRWHICIFGEQNGFVRFFGFNKTQINGTFFLFPR